MMERLDQDACGLKGVRLLVVEDEILLALALEDDLVGLGCDVIVASSLRKAMPLAREAPIDGAILDVNLAGEEVYPVVDILAARSIPFVFVTGYGAAGLRACDAGRLIVKKPYRLKHVVEALRSLKLMNRAE